MSAADKFLDEVKADLDEATQNCPTCGSACQVSEGTTSFYINLYAEQRLLRLVRMVEILKSRGVCYCADLHPDDPQDCGWCQALAELDRLAGGEGEK
jgi:hypothetical protein